MRRLVEIHNWLSDRDSIWFPFLFLKPKPQTPINRFRALTMTLCFGCYGFLLYVLYQGIFYQNWAASAEITRLIILIASFGLWFNLVTLPIWNIRAHAIASKS